MKPYRLAEKAREDLRGIWEYIANDNPDAADRFLDQVQEACELLARSPHLGHRHDYIRNQQVRVWPIYSYLLVYLPDTQPLEIVRVISGVRNLPAMDI